MTSRAVRTAAHALRPAGLRAGGPRARRRRGLVRRDQRQGHHQRRLHHHRRDPAADPDPVAASWAAGQAQGPPQGGGARPAPPARTCAAAGSRFFTPHGGRPSGLRSERPSSSISPSRRRPRRSPGVVASEGPAWSATSAAARPPCSRSTARSAATPSTARPPRALPEASERFEADDDARVMVLTGAGDEAFCAGADLKAIETLDPDAPGGPLGFTRLTPVQAHDRRDRGLVPRRRPRARALVRPARRHRDSQFGCAERRWGVPLIDGGTQRLPRIVGLGPRARPDPHRAHRRRRRGARDRAS